MQIPFHSSAPIDRVPYPYPYLYSSLSPSCYELEDPYDRKTPWNTTEVNPPPVPLKIESPQLETETMSTSTQEASDLPSPSGAVACLLGPSPDVGITGSEQKAKVDSPPVSFLCEVRPENDSQPVTVSAEHKPSSQNDLPATEENILEGETERTGQIDSGRIEGGCAAGVQNGRVVKFGTDAAFVSVASSDRELAVGSSQEAIIIFHSGIQSPHSDLVVEQKDNIFADSGGQCSMVEASVSLRVHLSTPDVTLIHPSHPPDEKTSIEGARHQFHVAFTTSPVRDQDRFSREENCFNISVASPKSRIRSSDAKEDVCYAPSAQESNGPAVRSTSPRIQVDIEVCSNTPTFGNDFHIADQVEGDYVCDSSIRGCSSVGVSTIASESCYTDDQGVITAPSTVPAQPLSMRPSDREQHANGWSNAHPSFANSKQKKTFELIKADTRGKIPAASVQSRLQHNVPKEPCRDGFCEGPSSGELLDDEHPNLPTQRSNGARGSKGKGLQSKLSKKRREIERLARREAEKTESGDAATGVAAWENVTGDATGAWEAPVQERARARGELDTFSEEGSITPTQSTVAALYLSYLAFFSDNPPIMQSPRPVATAPAPRWLQPIMHVEETLDSRMTQKAADGQRASSSMTVSTPATRNLTNSTWANRPDERTHGGNGKNGKKHKK